MSSKGRDNVLLGDMRNSKNSISPYSALIHIGTPKRPDMNHLDSVLLGDMRNSNSEKRKICGEEI